MTDRSSDHTTTAPHSYLETPAAAAPAPTTRRLSQWQRRELVNFREVLVKFVEMCIIECYQL